MPLDWDNHGKPKRERVSFPYEINLFLYTFGQNSGNNGFKVIFHLKYYRHLIHTLCQPF